MIEILTFISCHLQILFESPSLGQTHSHSDVLSAVPVRALRLDGARWAVLHYLLQ